MLGSLGWRVFFAAMLLMGIFAVLRAEGDTVSASAPNVVAMQGVTPSASVAENVQVDIPVYAEAAFKVAAAEVDQLALDEATLTFDMTKAAESYVAYTDTSTVANNQARAFHMLTFQGRFSPMVTLEAPGFSTPNGRGTAKEGRAHAPRGVRGFPPRLLS